MLLHLKDRLPSKGYKTSALDAYFALRVTFGYTCFARRNTCFLLCSLAGNLSLGCSNTNFTLRACLALPLIDAQSVRCNCFALARFKATFAFLRRQRKQYTQNSKLQVTEQKRFVCRTNCFLSSCNLRKCKANFSLKCSPT